MVKRHNLQPGNLTFLPRTATDSLPLSKNGFTKLQMQKQIKLKEIIQQKNGEGEVERTGQVLLI